MVQHFSDIAAAGVLLASLTIVRLPDRPLISVSKTQVEEGTGPPGHDALICSAENHRCTPKGTSAGNNPNSRHIKTGDIKTGELNALIQDRMSSLSPSQHQENIGVIYMTTCNRGVRQ